MSWPTMVVADVLSGAAAKTRGQDLYDRAICAKGGGSTVYFAEFTTTAAAYGTDHFTFTVRVPEYVRSGDKIQFTVYGYGSGGVAGTFRLRETGGPTNGTDATLPTSRDLATSEITVPDDTWAGAVKTFAVQAHGDGVVTVTVNSARLCANLRVKTT